MRKTHWIFNLHLSREPPLNLYKIPAGPLSLLRCLVSFKHGQTIGKSQFICKTLKLKISNFFLFLFCNGGANHLKCNVSSLTTMWRTLWLMMVENAHGVGSCYSRMHAHVSGSRPCHNGWPLTCNLVYWMFGTSNPYRLL